jgi:hypothetical protein
MRTALFTLALAAGLSACSGDSPLTGPGASPVADAADPVADAIDRIAPALGSGDAAAQLRADLARVQGGVGAAAAAVEQTLARLEQDDPATSADVDAIRLALHYSR